MQSVSSVQLRPFVNYLVGAYNSLEEVSEISGIELTLLHDIKDGEEHDIEATEAKRLVDFLLTHRRKTADVFYSFEDKDTTARFPGKEIREMRDKEVRMLRRERKKRGW